MKSMVEVVQNLLKPYIDSQIQTLTNKGVSRYNTVSEMVLDDNIQTDILQTMGYNSIDDFGGAFYEVVDNNSSGHCEALANGKYAKLLIPVEGITLQMLGVTDSTADIHDALVEAQTLSDNVILVGNLTLTQDTNITSNIIGINEKAIITLDGGSFIFNNYKRSFENVNIVNNNPSKYALDCTYVRETAQFKNILITNGSGIKITKSWYFVFENVRVSNTNNTGIGMQIICRDDGGVNAASFNNVHLGGGLHSLQFIVDPNASSPYGSEALVFNGCGIEGSYGSAIDVPISDRIIDGVTFIGCYFEHCNSGAVADASILTSNIVAAGTIPFSFINCITRITANKPFFKGTVNVDNLKNANGHELLDSYDVHATLTKTSNILCPLPKRFLDTGYNKLTAPITEPYDTLQHFFNRCFVEENLTSGNNDIVIHFNGNTIGTGVIDLSMIVRPYSTVYNHAVLRILYTTASDNPSAKVTVVDSLETQVSPQISNVTFTADVDVSDPTDYKVVLHINTSNAYWLGRTHFALMNGCDYTEMIGYEFYMNKA